MSTSSSPLTNSAPGEPTTSSIDQAEVVVDAQAKAFVHNGSSLRQYLASGKKKNKRVFWVQGTNLAWGTRKKPSNPNKSHALKGVLDQPVVQSAKEWFDAVDASKNGKLDASELRLLYQRARGENLSSSKVRKAMRQMDTSGDGAIDFEEFDVWWRHNGGDLEKFRHCAFTLITASVQLLVVAPDPQTKRQWVNGVRAVLGHPPLDAAAPEPEPEPEPETETETEYSASPGNRRH